MLLIVETSKSPLPSAVAVNGSPGLNDNSSLLNNNNNNKGSTNNLFNNSSPTPSQNQKTTFPWNHPVPYGVITASQPVFGRQRFSPRGEAKTSPRGGVASPEGSNPWDNVPDQPILR